VTDALCLDAGVMLKLVLPERGSEDAETLITEALDATTELIGPGFLFADALSVLRRRLQQGQMDLAEADEAMEYLLALPLVEMSGPEVYRRAWQIAEQLKLPVVCDSGYLAVAESSGAAFWTADRALFNRAKGLGYVHMLGGVT
jgi:predicted nucleic acid-binding protein